MAEQESERDKLRKRMEGEVAAQQRESNRATTASVAIASAKAIGQLFASGSEAQIIANTPPRASAKRRRK